MDLSACKLWTDPQATVARPMREAFELLETLGKESHWWRYILGCRCCGQKYFFEFHEDVDWAAGDDPQFSVWVPFTTEAELAALKAARARALDTFVPRLCKDYPKGAAKPHIYWVRPGAG